MRAQRSLVFSWQPGLHFHLLGVEITIVVQQALHPEYIPSTQPTCQRIDRAALKKGKNVWTVCMDLGVLSRRIDLHAFDDEFQRFAQMVPAGLVGLEHH